MKRKLCNSDLVDQNNPHGAIKQKEFYKFYKHLLSVMNVCRAALLLGVSGPEKKK
jgi:hypothetical protein